MAPPSGKKYRDGQTPLSWAVDMVHEAFVRLLLDNGVGSTKGADVESMDKVGRAPLSQAAARGHEGIARQLLKKGAGIESKDHNGQTPLSWAAKNGHKAVMRLLLEKGADEEAKDKHDGKW